jgi:hypothetical protein
MHAIAGFVLNATSPWITMTVSIAVAAATLDVALCPPFPQQNPLPRGDKNATKRAFCRDFSAEKECRTPV